jgi:hypothetical protein
MKFPTYEEVAKDVAEKAMDDFLFNGKSIREWAKLIIDLGIPENPTNGDVITALFPRNNMLVNESLGEKGTVFFESEDNVILYSLDWWNAPWEGQK